MMQRITERLSKGEAYIELTETLSELRIALPGAQLLHIFLLHSAARQRPASLMLSGLLDKKEAP